MLGSMFHCIIELVGMFFLLVEKGGCRLLEGLKGLFDEASWQQLASWGILTVSCFLWMAGPETGCQRWC